MHRIKLLISLCLLSFIIFTGCKASHAGHTHSSDILDSSSIGGDAGKRIGENMDKQAEELSKLLNAKVERIGEGIRITFETGLLFDINSSYLRETSKQNLSDLASVLSKYSDTNVLIEGHTDSTGEDQYNKWLSDRRSNSVKGFLAENNIEDQRMQTAGYGEEKPVGDNKNAEGRQANRRVEISIYANAEMVRKARTKQLN